MSKIRLIKPDTTIKELHIDHINWDVEIKGVPYQIVRIEGYVHTIRGKHGDNDLWMYPLGQEPSYENLLQYNSYKPGPCWGIKMEPYNYVKDEECRTATGAMITRNGRDFYYCSGPIGFSQAQYMISGIIDEHPALLNFRDFDKHLIGREIMYRNQNAVIKTYLGGTDARIVITLENNMSKEAVTTIFDPMIDWFRY